ncbi:hypothetical protein JHK85_004653 [Glycine max]|nr:hypothetical protein JHK85_004653 [Glycine max]
MAHTDNDPTIHIKHYFDIGYLESIDLKSKREKWERAIQAKLIAKIAKEKTTKVTQVRTNLETSDALPKDVKKVASQASSNVAKAD